MSFLETRRKAAAAERRRSVRFAIEIPVILRTVVGDRNCRMENISDKGAKLETDTPPKEGMNCWLVLGEEEIYCRVVWANETSCGVEFERAISENRLIAMLGKPSTNNSPVAKAGNIKMGRKRSGLLVSQRSGQADFISKRQACSNGSV